MSTHQIPIIEITEIKPHNNADKLELVRIQGWQTAVRKGDFKVGDKAVWLEPDYIVDTNRPEFSFLQSVAKRDGKVRIKVKKLRGEMSQGLLITLPEQFKNRQVGDDLYEELGIERYEPDVHIGTGGGSIKGPPGVYVVKYDVENFNSYRDKVLHYFDEQEVVVQEKLNGANCRFVFCSSDQTFYIGSRTMWKNPAGDNLWTMVCNQYPEIEKWCRDNPDHILCGEVFGTVGGMKYGASPGQLFFAAFDIMKDGKWIDWPNFYDMTLGKITIAPILDLQPFNERWLRELAEKDSAWPGAKHLSEGIVFKLKKELEVHRIGRMQFKIVSNRYLSND